MTEVFINFNYRTLLHCSYIYPLATKQEKCHTGWHRRAWNEHSPFQPRVKNKKLAAWGRVNVKARKDRDAMPKEGARGWQDKGLRGVWVMARLKANTGGPVTESPATTSLLSPTPPEPLQLNPQTERLAWLLPFSANATQVHTGL